MTPFDLVSLALASAALAYFLTEHEGPFSIMRLLRTAGQGVRDENGECLATTRNPIGQALCCAECTSFWCALILSVILWRAFLPVEVLAIWGGALIVLRWINN